VGRLAIGAQILVDVSLVLVAMRLARPTRERAATAPAAAWSYRLFPVVNAAYTSADLALLPFFVSPRTLAPYVLWSRVLAVATIPADARSRHVLAGDPDYQRPPPVSQAVLTALAAIVGMTLGSIAFGFELDRRVLVAFVLLAAAGGARALAYVWGSLISTAGEQSARIATVAVALVANVVLNVVLDPLLGVQGAAVAMLVGDSTALMLYVMIYRVRVAARTG
jgi:hypothetical protein